MSLNNAGDEVVLLDAVTMERDRFAYAASMEEVRSRPAISTALRTCRVFNMMN